MAIPRVILVNRVYWPNESATAQLLTDLAEALAERGWEVHVLCAGRRPPEVRHGVRIHRSDGATEQFRSITERARGYIHFLRAARRELAALVRPGDVVVVKTDPPMLGAALTRLATRRGARVVHWVQDIYPEIALRHSGAWLRPALLPLRLARDDAWQRAAACVAVGEDMAALVRRHGVSAERVQVLPNWAPREMEQRVTAAEVAAQRADWGWTDRFVVMYSGNLGRVHEFQTLLDAAHRLPDVRFAFVGSGARWGEVTEAVRAARLDNVQFLPPQARAVLPVTLAAGDVHAVTLLPGYEELVHPSKVSGALAAARPVAFIGPPQSALARFLRENGAGAAFAPGQSDQLAAALAAWRADAAQRLHVAANARRAYDAHLRFPALAAKWDDLLRRVGAGSALPSPEPAGISSPPSP